MNYLKPSFNGACISDNAWDDVLNKGLYALTVPNKWVVEKLSFFQRLNKGAFLDLGCGLGRHIEPLIGALRLSVGLDISDTAIRKARSRIKSDSSTACVVKGFIDNLPFKNEVFGSVLAWRCLYLQDLEGIIRTIAEIRRVLCPDGQIICSVRSTTNTLYYIGKEKGKEIEKNTFHFPDEDFHGVNYHFFTENEIYRLFHGFKIKNLFSTTLTHTSFTVNQPNRTNDFWVFTARKR